MCATLLILPSRRTHLRKNDRPVQHPQPAGTSPVEVHRYRTRRHQQVGMAGQPAPGLLLLLHGTLWPTQLLLCCWEREQGTCPLQPNGEDASALWATSRQTRWFLDYTVSCASSHFFFSQLSHFLGHLVISTISSVILHPCLSQPTISELKVGVVVAESLLQRTLSSNRCSRYFV